MILKNNEKSEKEFTFKIDKKNLTMFDLSTWKPQKFTLKSGCFWQKYIMFELKSYREPIFDYTRGWCKI